MIKQNLELALNNRTPGTCISFTDMLQAKSTLNKYCEATGKDAVEYFGLMQNSPLLFTPYTKKSHTRNNLSGLQKSHRDFVVGKTPSNLDDFLEIVKLLQPKIAITPIEEMEALSVGKKRV
jgi:hypothetical protein